MQILYHDFLADHSGLNKPNINLQAFYKIYNFTGFTHISIYLIRESSGGWRRYAQKCLRVFQYWIRPCKVHCYSDIPPMGSSPFTWNSMVVLNRHTDTQTNPRCACAPKFGITYSHGPLGCGLGTSLLPLAL